MGSGLLSRLTTGILGPFDFYENIGALFLIEFRSTEL